MKKTPLSHVHEKLGGRMVEFGGWWMPIQYTGIIAEHNAVRTSAGIFDLSHMGEFFIQGPDAEKFLQRLVTNDVSRMVDGRVMYTPMCNEQGGIVDDILVYRFSDQKYMLVVNASNIDKDFNWFNAYKGRQNLELTNQSETCVLIAVQGPKSVSILQPLTKTDLSAIKYYWFAESFCGDIPVLLSRTGYTGEDGFELYAAASQGEKLWELVMKSSKYKNLVPVGLGARDSLRLEASFSLYGNELDDETTPLEAGLGWTVKLEKGDFIGKEPLLKQKSGAFTKQLVCFAMKGSGIPRHGYKLYLNNAEQGRVTSGTFSPTFKKGIGMGYISCAEGKEGEELQIDIRGTKQPGIIAKRPFYRN
ncbi:MAG: glycine cleavage system aminomethyltransferase GcvT [bacterium]